MSVILILIEISKSMLLCNSYPKIKSLHISVTTCINPILHVLLLLYAKTPQSKVENMTVVMCYAFNLLFILWCCCILNDMPTFYSFSCLHRFSNSKLHVITMFWRIWGRNLFFILFKDKHRGKNIYILELNQ